MLDFCIPSIFLCSCLGYMQWRHWYNLPTAEDFLSLNDMPLVARKRLSLVYE